MTGKNFCLKKEKNSSNFFTNSSTYVLYTYYALSPVVSSTYTSKTIFITFFLISFEIAIDTFFGLQNLFLCLVFPRVFWGEHGEGVTRQLAKGWVKYELSELGMVQTLKVFNNVDFVYERTELQIYLKSH